METIPAPIIDAEGKAYLRGRMVVRTTRPSRGSEKRKTSVAVKDCRTDSAGIGCPCSLESERPFSVHGGT